jgi:cyclic pyranopterin phosphate synthase
MYNQDVWEPLNSIRLKVTDRCHWNCWWCHNEGTGPRNPSAVGDVYWDESTKSAIARIVTELELTEIHLTGGEPTAHPKLTTLVKGLRDIGMTVKATSIGCEENKLHALADSGLQGINFSVHSVNSEMLYMTQKNRSPIWVKIQLERQLHAIQLAQSLGLEVKINTVLANTADILRVLGVLQWAKLSVIPFRVMNEFSSAAASYNAIHQFLDEIDAIEIYTKRIAGSSSVATYYCLPDGYSFAFKKIGRQYLEKTMCSGCRIRAEGNCGEKFYGIRLEKRKVDNLWRLFVRLRVHHTDQDTLLPIDDFLASRQLQEIKDNMRIPFSLPKTNTIDLRK